MPTFLQAIHIRSSHLGSETRETVRHMPLFIAPRRRVLFFRRTLGELSIARRKMARQFLSRLPFSDCVFFLTVVTAARLAFGLLRGQKPSILFCRASFVVCASLSFWFRFELASLGDDVFFALNELNFRSKIRTAGDGSSSVILHARSSYNFYVIFVHSGSRSLTIGHLSPEEIDSFQEDLDFVRGCRVYARNWKDRFYILRALC
jgi:hypothetical protein